MTIDRIVNELYAVQRLVREAAAIVHNTQSAAAEGALSGQEIASLLEKAVKILDRVA